MSRTSCASGTRSAWTWSTQAYSVTRSSPTWTSKSAASAGGGAYPDLDRQTRILLSDYLVACARAVADNLIEAQVERLELDHAVDDFRKWIERGIRPGRSRSSWPLNA
ncbi:hypothetical protein ABZX95_47645 [Streptomyces sp. NPDC004232]|uniref:hypothetical protein n=1 Tax=Streptomyces sp. NPDC004232 TaxID=3154454 RepID=UPI001D2D11E4|nr:hypothetical protein [Streptomyces sp. tea 10]